MDFRDLSLQLHFLLKFEFLLELLLLLSEFLLDLLKKSWLTQVKFFRLFASHNELTRILLILLLLGILTDNTILSFSASELRSVRELVEAFIHELSNFGSELLPFLVPAPFVDLSFRKTRFLGDFKQSLLRPVGVLVEFSHESLELISTLPLSFPDNSLKLAVFINYILALRGEARSMS